MVPVDPPGAHLSGAHLSTEQIALRALGEPAADTDGVEDAHLAGCAECSRELASLHAVVGIARDPAAAGRGPGLVAPPAQVWDGIRAELGLGRNAGQVPPPGPAPQAPPPRRVVPVTPRGGSAEGRGRTAWIALAAAVAGVAAGAGADALLRDRGSDTGGEVVLARAGAWLRCRPARVPAPPCWSAPAGGLRLVVTTSGLDALDDGFHEVWPPTRAPRPCSRWGCLGRGDTEASRCRRAGRGCARTRSSTSRTSRWTATWPHSARRVSAVSCAPGRPAAGPYGVARGPRSARRLAWPRAADPVPTLTDRPVARGLAPSRGRPTSRPSPDRRDRRRGRLTGSGLGCSTWPRRVDESWTPTPEYGVHGTSSRHRLLTYVPAAVALATLVAMWRHRRPAATCAAWRC